MPISVTRKRATNIGGSMVDAQTTEDRICCYLADHPASLRNRICEALAVDPVTALRGLVSLQKAGRVRAEGKTKGTRYSLHAFDEGEAA